MTKKMVEEAKRLRKKKERGLNSPPLPFSDKEQNNIEMTYRRIFDEMREGALIFGLTSIPSFRNGLILYSNRRFAELVKRPLPRVIGSCVFDFVSDGDAEVLKAMLIQLRTERTAQRAIHLKTADGEVLDVLFSIGLTLRKAVTYAIITDLTEMTKKEHEAKRLASELITAQEGERKRIANELHDGLASDLSALKMAMESKVTSTSPIGAEELTGWLQGSIDELRRIMTTLHPSILDDIGIGATISWYCREYQKRHPNIRVEPVVSVSEDEIPIPLKTAIYRICQESLTNIAKHSKADLVTLSLKRNSKGLELAIKDNGQGFDLNDTSRDEHGQKGFGLSSMKERTEILGGTFSITSSKGAGTQLHASWPI